MDYICINNGDVNSELEIVETLEYIRALYHHPNRIKKPEDHIYVAVYGDQPIFKMVFVLWFKSYNEWASSGAKSTIDQGSDDLFRWMLPLPGGFHIDKKGIIPLIKEYMCGSGLEELLQFSGLSPTLQKGFQKFSQYRPNRRFLLQVLVAMVLHLDESLASLSSTFAEIREACLLEISREQKMDEELKRRVWTSNERRETQQTEMPEEASLEIEASVSPSVLTQTWSRICARNLSPVERFSQSRFFRESAITGTDGAMTWV